MAERGPRGPEGAVPKEAAESKSERRQHDQAKIERIMAPQEAFEKGHEVAIDQSRKKMSALLENWPTMSNKDRVKGTLSTGLEYLNRSANWVGLSVSRGYSTMRYLASTVPDKEWRKYQRELPERDRTYAWIDGLAEAPESIPDQPEYENVAQDRLSQMMKLDETLYKSWYLERDERQKRAKALYNSWTEIDPVEKAKGVLGLAGSFHREQLAVSRQVCARAARKLRLLCSVVPEGEVEKYLAKRPEHDAIFAWIQGKNPAPDMVPTTEAYRPPSREEKGVDVAKRYLGMLREVDKGATVIVAERRKMMQELSGKWARMSNLNRLRGISDVAQSYLGELAHNEQAFSYPLRLLMMMDPRFSEAEKEKAIKELSEDDKLIAWMYGGGAMPESIDKESYRWAEEMQKGESMAERLLKKFISGQEQRLAEAAEIGKWVEMIVKDWDGISDGERVVRLQGLAQAIAMTEVGEQLRKIKPLENLLECSPEISADDVRAAREALASEAA